MDELDMNYKLIKEKVSAVHDEDLEKILDGLGILKKIQKRLIKCKFCRETVSMENIHSIFPQSGDIKVVCDNKECIRILNGYLRDDEISL